MIIVSLYDYTGVMLQPWADAGYECICVDIQHTKEVQEKNRIGFIKLDLSAYSVDWQLLELELKGKSVFIFGFPVCTDLALSGAPHWKKKREKNIYFQEEAAQCAKNIAILADALSAPYMIENPRGALDKLWRKHDYGFHPYEFGGYLSTDEKHDLYPDYIEPQDAYEKYTCIWIGNNFILPMKWPVIPKFMMSKGKKYSRQFAKLGGKSKRTKNIRSVTPKGFARAVYYANGPTGKGRRT